MEFVKLNTNENPYPLLARGEGGDWSRLPGRAAAFIPDPMATAFRERAAELYRHEVPGITPDWILCGNGSDDILTIVTRSFVAPGGLIRFPRPSYILYNTLAAIQGPSRRRSTLKATGRSALPSPRRTSGCNSRSCRTPTARPAPVIAPASKVAKLAAALPAPSSSTRPTPTSRRRTALGSVAENERVIVTRTLSKSYSLAGLRFGFVGRPAADHRATDQGEGLVQLRFALDRQGDGGDR